MVPLLPTSEIQQWSYTNIDPDNKTHLTKDAASLPIQNHEVSLLVRLYKSKPVKYRKGDYSNVKISI